MLDGAQIMIIPSASIRVVSQHVDNRHDIELAISS